MKITYKVLDRDKLKQIQLYEELKKLFQQLLLRLAGDAERVAEVMREFQDSGYIAEDIDLNDFFKRLEAEKLVRRTAGALKSTQRGKYVLREHVFNEIFAKLRKGGNGEHLLPQRGGDGGEAAPEKRKFFFGDDPQTVDYCSSFFNTIKRSASLDLCLEEQDLEVYEQDRATNLALVLMIDISHSMILYGEDRITPAKELALALTHIIRRQYPKDELSVVLFGDDAVTISPAELGSIAVGPYHTNTQMGLRKARELLLKKRQANKQIIMITDGKPSMIKLSDGRYYKNSFGLDPEIVKRTLDEAILCRKRSIPITTFMIADDPVLVEFVRKLTKVNLGKAFYCSPDNLGTFVVDNFMRQKRKYIR